MQVRSVVQGKYIYGTGGNTVLVVVELVGNGFRQTAVQICYLDFMPGFVGYIDADWIRQTNDERLFH